MKDEGLERMQVALPCMEQLSIKLDFDDLSPLYEKIMMSSDFRRKDLKSVGRRERTMGRTA